MDDTRMTDERLAEIERGIAEGRFEMAGRRELLDALLAERAHSERKDAVLDAARELAKAADAILGEDTPETCAALAGASVEFQEAERGLS